MSRKHAREDDEPVHSDGDYAADETPKALSKTSKKAKTPSLASSSVSTASGASSPIKQIRFAATQETGFLDRKFENNITRLPRSLRKLRQELVDMKQASQWLPDTLKDDLQGLGDFASSAFFDPDVQECKWRIPPTSVAQDIFDHAFLCDSERHGESSWNMEVHRRVLDFAFRESGDPAFGDYRYCTGAQILPQYKPIAASSKCIDFCVCIRPPETWTEHSRINEMCKERPGVSINHTDWGDLCFNPIALTIETKRQVEWDKALLQLATWHSAQWRALQFKSVLNKIEFLGGIIVQGHEWWFVASTLENGRSVIYHRIWLGGTENFFDLYKLLLALQCVGSWVKDEFWPAFRADLLGMVVPEPE
ncbi:hypothetical protein ACHAPU_011037 [Fusarium lateritium]